MPFRLSTILGPIVGRHADGPVGKAEKSITLIATVLARTTMLGLGGLSLGNSIESELSLNAGAVITIAVIALVAYFCVTVRMDRFVRMLSLMGTSLLIVIAATVLIVGPTEFQLHTRAY